MSSHRIFVSQETLDRWLAEELVIVDGDVLVLLPGRQNLKLISAVHFLRDVTDGGDPYHLLGKVKEITKLEALQGEHCADSVVIGDSAYEVTEGFIGVPMRNNQVNKIDFQNAGVMSEEERDTLVNGIDMIARFVDGQW